MAIPTAITDLSATIASNSPSGSDAAFPNIDDYLRAAYGFIRQSDTKASDVASAASVDLGAVVGRIVDVTGTTTITSFGTVAAGIWRIVRFTGALTLTHHATSLILPGGANITTAAGDCLVAVSLGSGNWVVTHFQPAEGYATKTYADDLEVDTFVQAIRSGNQTSGTTITFDSEPNDSATAFVHTTGIFTAPATGWYLIQIGTAFKNVTGTGTVHTLSLVHNSTAVSALTVTVPDFGATAIPLTMVRYLTASDTVHAETSSALTTGIYVDNAWMTIMRVAR